jgi:hypothetical protein
MLPLMHHTDLLLLMRAAIETIDGSGEMSVLQSANAKKSYCVRHHGLNQAQGGSQKIGNQGISGQARMAVRLSAL